MKITIARNAGFCFGVRRAINITFKVRQKNPGRRIFTIGPIIHNPQVIDALSRRGIGILKDLFDSNLRNGDMAIIRAHGISPENRLKLKDNGVKVIDATCPMVLKVHSIIKKAAQDADLIAIVGDLDHPEMKAHLGYAAGKGVPVTSIEDARQLPSVKRLAVVAQTTFDVNLYRQILDELKNKTEVLDIHDTICRSTVERQKEVEELAKDHDTYIVIGGKNSANTRRLYEIALAQKRNVIKVEDASNLKDIDTASFNRVAIIAGASTPQWVIEECVDKLRDAGSKVGLRNKALEILAASPLCASFGSVGIAMAATVFAGKSYDWSTFLAIFFLTFATVNKMKIGPRSWLFWSVATGIAASIAILTKGLYAGILTAGIAIMRPLVDSGGVKPQAKGIYGLINFLLVSIVVPLGIEKSNIPPGIILLIAYASVQYLGTEVLTGLKNMEKDAIMGLLTLARFFGESKVILGLEYTIMGLALVLFLSFPVKLAPAIVYGLLPALFMLAKGIDFYSDHKIFDNRLYTVYVQSLWLIPFFMGILWRVTMMPL